MSSYTDAGLPCDDCKYRLAGWWNVNRIPVVLCVGCAMTLRAAGNRVVLASVHRSATYANRLTSDKRVTGGVHTWARGAR